MILFDTNIFIYFANGALRASILKNHSIAFASITKIEALGYMHLTVIEQNYLNELFTTFEQIDLDEEVIQKAIFLRQKSKMTLGDAIVGATAIAYDLELWTANEEDFKNMEGIRIYNPLK